MGVITSRSLGTTETCGYPGFLQNTVFVEHGDKAVRTPGAVVIKQSEPLSPGTRFRVTRIDPIRCDDYVQGGESVQYFAVIGTLE